MRNQETVNMALPNTKLVRHDGAHRSDEDDEHGNFKNDEFDLGKPMAEPGQAVVGMVYRAESYTRQTLRPAEAIYGFPDHGEKHANDADAGIIDFKRCPRVRAFQLAIEVSKSGHRDA